MYKLEFKLDVFEGPLDLLLQLITKNKVSIYDIPITLITEQYLTVLDGMHEMDLEVSSDFLVMATKLLYIKSKMLLPVYGEQEEDPRDDLAQKLIEYQMYKELSEKLKTKEFSDAFTYYKDAEKIDIKNEEQETLTIDINDLLMAFNDVLEKIERKKPPEKERFSGIIGREKVSIKQKIKEVMNMIRNRGKVLFSEIFEGETSKPSLIAMFLGVLEMLKMNKILLKNSGKNDFVITINKSGDNDEY